MIVLETLGRRWFAFAFIAAVLWAAWPAGGWRRGVRFLAIAFACSLAAEYASTHTGFPYGRYDYIAATHGKELYIANVPLFVPLSFGSVVWAGRALAEGTWAARSRIGLALGGAVFATLIDFAADPMTVRGSTWFLGSLYRYRHGGAWFGIPWSNFAGWILVSAVIVWVDTVIGRTPADESAAPRGRALAFGMCAFFFALALATRSWRIAGGAAGLTAVIALIRMATVRGPARVARPAEAAP